MQIKLYVISLYSYVAEMMEVQYGYKISDCERFTWIMSADQYVQQNYSETSSLDGEKTCKWHYRLNADGDIKIVDEEVTVIHI